MITAIQRLFAYITLTAWPLQYTLRVFIMTHELNFRAIFRSTSYFKVLIKTPVCLHSSASNIIPLFSFLPRFPISTREMPAERGLAAFKTNELIL
jgi:hypothetical protein